MKKHSFHTLLNMSLCAAAIQLTGCSTVPKTDPNSPPPTRGEFKPVEGQEYLLNVSDPLEGYNRGAYKFNYGFDKYVFLPVVNTYEFILPDYAEDRVSSFFKNVDEVRNFYNNLLQAKFKSTGITLGRFVVNSTVGLLGLYDPASHWGMKRKKADLGQTFGVWGIGSGAYIVLPVLGPSNARDAVGTGGDMVINSQIGPISWIDDDDAELALNATKAVDIRHNLKFRYEQSGSPFEYELVRLFYSMKREHDVASGE